MKITLGDPFRAKRKKPSLPAFQFKTIKSSEGKTKRAVKIINLHNLYVSLYVYGYAKLLYPLLCRFVFPFSWALNRLWSGILHFISSFGILHYLFESFYFFYKLVLTNLPYFISLRSLGVVFYYWMVHLQFKNLDSQLRDWVAKKLKLTANNKQTSIDWLMEILINSYMYYDTTDIKYTYTTDKKRQWISFFLLYPPKEPLVISNKKFFEKSFGLFEAYHKGDKITIEKHKQYCRNRFFVYFSVLLRPNLRLLVGLLWFLILTFVKTVLLLFLGPLVSLFCQLVWPLLQILLASVFWLKQLIVQLLYAIRDVVATLIGLPRVLFSFWNISRLFLNNPSLSYRQLMAQIIKTEEKREQQAIRVLKYILLIPYRIYDLFPSGATLKKILVEEMIKRNVEPTLQAEEHGFLFLHKQKSRFNQKSRQVLEVKLIDHLLSRDEFKYWEFDPEDDLDPLSERVFENYLTSGPLYPQIMEQEETDEEDEEDEDIDFWLMFNNASEYDVVADFEALVNALMGFLFRIPGINLLVVYVSVVWHYVVQWNRRFLNFFNWLDVVWKYEDYNAFVHDWWMKFWTMSQNWFVAPAFALFAHHLWFNVYFVYKTKFYTEYVIITGYAAGTLFFTLLGIVVYLLGFVYMTEHMYRETAEHYEVAEHEDTSFFYDESTADNEGEEFALETWLLTISGFSFATWQALNSSPYRLLPGNLYHRNSNSIDFVYKIDCWIHVWSQHVAATFEYIISFFSS